MSKTVPTEKLLTNKEVWDNLVPGDLIIHVLVKIHYFLHMHFLLRRFLLTKSRRSSFPLAILTQSLRNPADSIGSDMLPLQIGDLVRVESAEPEGFFVVLILSDAQSTCNSDGEEWWIEWKGKNVKTDKYFNVSSRYHKFEKI